MTSNHEQLEKRYNALRDEYRDFAYIVSHDLAAPFRQIQSFVQLIKTNYAEGLDDESERYFELIDKITHNGKELVSSLAEFSRLNTNAKPKTQVDCNQLMDKVLVTLDGQIKDAKADIQIENLPTLHGDPGHLQLLFYHLLDNAIKFHKNDVAPLIVVKARSLETEHEISVIDNGIGIDSKHFDKIFNALRRGVSNDYPGVGIGLAICKSIVERVGGQISVESEVDKGSCFKWTWPKTVNQ